MEKYVFIQSQKSVGFCKYDERKEFVYDNDIKIQRYCVLEATSEGIEELFNIIDSDIETFVNIIQEELANNFYTIYQN